MSFAKFIDLLQRKQLWFTNAEYLEDKWEVMLNNDQINSIIKTRPPSLSVENASELVNNSIKTIRKLIFINCWTADDNESHALWRIYCPSSEGVAIQTTVERLKNSLIFPILEVSYMNPNTNSISLDPYQLVTQKRPVYSYEKEVRIVIVNDFTSIIKFNQITIGAHVDWDPELHIENIWIHPDASLWFMRTVTDTVLQLAPKLAPDGNARVYWSTINSSPPIK